MKKVVLKFEDYNQYGDRSGINIEVDGKLIASGSYGGEPEDNSRLRDYWWVERSLSDLAQALGAEVETVEVPYCEETER